MKTKKRTTERRERRKQSIVEDIRRRVMARRNMEQTPTVTRSRQRLERWLFRLSNEGGAAI